MTHPAHGRRAAVALVGKGLGLAGLASLSACGASLLPKPPRPPARFTLDSAAPAAPPDAARQPAAADTPALVVDLPRAAPGFDSARMVYLRRAQELEAYALHEWVDTPARLLAPLLVRALQASGAFSVVLLAPSAAQGALRLETELIRLQQDFSTRPSQLRLTLRAVLLHTGTRRVLGWREFDETVPAASDDAPGGAAAAQVATQRVLLALAAFCAAQAVR